MSAVLNSALVEKQGVCNCAPCRRFWKKAFREGERCITLQSSERACMTATLGNQRGLVRRGDRVLVSGSAIDKSFDSSEDRPFQGVVQYVGIADEDKIAPELRVGVCLYDNIYSTHNGIYKGRRFFHTPRGHGAMVRYSDITPLKPITKTPPVTGNDMFESYEEVRRRRKQREKKILEAEEKLRKEHELKRQAQMQRSSKSAPPPRISPRPTKASKLRTEKQEDKPRQPLQDEDDIAYKDYQAKERQKQDQYMDEQTMEEMRFKQMVKQFGGGEKGERLAHTFMKLNKAHEDGRIYALAERE